MRLLARLFQRFLVFCLGLLTVWLIVFVVFDTADNRLPWILAACLTYGVAAYVILPNVVRLGLKILHRGLIPKYTIAVDGLPGDPVNFVLIGTLQQLREAFATAGWSTADHLGIASSLRMMRAFLMNSAYPTAPFSTFYLFGRRQDIGFQEPIDDSPRKRHHIRFWALDLAHSEEDMSSPSFWLKTDKPSPDERVLWVGAGTRDTGLSLTWLTFQITHATDSDTNAERDYIVNELKAKCVVGDVVLHQSGSRLMTGKVNHYITDGDVAFASLTVGATDGNHAQSSSPVNPDPASPAP
ncbi:LssY C-terminal domain-containing protein [Rhizobium sp. BK376]|uniref:LssY C-terminal domain-containing protein n=1 Tax=Rhizobium sp. BK376 TaxID=2512149 RepID=UPI001043B45D|nr:LssY C-terminal domain-containing protein [Rhizobium sp. BK376]TCR83898.1 LssY-like putative type I secretion system component LssY [Rhizobium sp. BK376]